LDNTTLADETESLLPFLPGDNWLTIYAEYIYHQPFMSIVHD
jgi:hypothetical protein